MALMQELNRNGKTMFVTHEPDIASLAAEQ
jgi:ABC-type lipoprotein export system ATPase subunit